MNKLLPLTLSAVLAAATQAAAQPVSNAAGAARRYPDHSILKPKLDQETNQ